MVPGSYELELTLYDTLARRTSVRKEVAITPKPGELWDLGGGTLNRQFDPNPISRNFVDRRPRPGRPEWLSKWLWQVGFGRDLGLRPFTLREESAGRGCRRRITGTKKFYELCPVLKRKGQAVSLHANRFPFPIR